jgi:dGTPase
MEYLKIEINIEELLYPNDLDDYFKFEKNRKMLIETQLEVIKNMSLSEVMQQRDCIKFIKCILEDHYAFLSVICDYISGMTDNYAEEEYRQLYQT